MRMTLLVFLVAASVCLAGAPAPQSTQSPLPELRQEHREMRDKDGQAYGFVEKLYRGKERILETVQYKTARGIYAAGGWFRIYRAKGRPVLLEEDTKGDGNVTMRVFSKDGELGVTEAFRRQADGSVAPVSSEDLLRLNLEAVVSHAAAQDLVGRIEKAVETHKTADEAIEDLKKQAEELKNSAKDKGDEHKQ